MATVLLVEDDIMLADCYKRWLTAMGHKVQHVPEVTSAIDAVDECLPDVVVLDLLLPGASGVQLLHVLKSHADLSQIPIVLCSSALAPDTLNVREYGVVQVLNKATLTRHALARAVAGACHAAL